MLVSVVVKQTQARLGDSPICFVFNTCNEQKFETALYLSASMQPPSY